MIVLKFTSDINKLANALRNKADAAIDQIRRGMFEGVRFFEGDAIKEFYSGRKGSVGLNVITGTLRRGWLTKTIVSYDDFIVQLGNKVKYGPTHEFGDVRPVWGGPQIGQFKKRTDITGKWKREGYKYLNRAVTARLSRFVKVKSF